MRCNDVSGPLSNKVQGGYNEAGSAPPSVNHAAEAALALVLVTHCMSGTWGEWSIFSIYQTSLFTGGVSPPSRQDRAGPGARWKCLIRSHKGSGECGVYCLNRDTARCWSALYCPLPGQGRKHVNMNEYTAPPPAACSITLPGYTDSPSACPVCKMPQHTCSGVLLSVLSMSTLQWWRVQHSVPSCQFIYIHCVLWTEVPKQDTMAGECNYFILLRTFVKSNECCQRPLRGWGACWAAPRGPGRCNGSLIAPAPNTVPGSPMTKFAQK